MGENGWNRSSPVRAKTDKRGVKPSRVWRGILAGLAVAVPVIALCIMFFADGDSVQRMGSGGGRKFIKEAKPALTVAKDEVKVSASMSSAPNAVMQSGSAGAVSSNESQTPAKEEKGGVDLRKFRKRRFEFESEEQIAMLLETKPGDFILGDCECGDQFVKDFNDSLFKEIEIKEDDDEKTKCLKRDVTAAKAELKAAMDRGEDITKIIKDTYYDLQKIGRYKDELELQLAELRRDEKVSYADYEDFVAAANKMLEEKGAAPIRHPKFLWRNIKNMKEVKNEEM